jgi:MFS family permease
LIGLLATIGASGFYFPQLFTANFIERIPIKRDVVVKIGMFTERLPIFLLPLSALLAPLLPWAALALFFVLFAWHSFGAGAIAVAWQDMLAKIFPVRTRGRFLGITSVAGTASGVLGAMLAAYLLDHFIFPYGYAISFALAGVMIFLSWIFIRMTREPAVYNTAPPVPHLEYWKRIPAILRKDRNFRWFIVCQMILYLGGMAWGFVAVYATERWNLSDGYVGGFTAWMLVGTSVGQLFAGMIGDRWGNKRALVMSTVAVIISSIIVLAASQPSWFPLAFALRGLGFGGFFVGGLMVLEFSHPEVRPTYIGIGSTATGLAGMVAPLIGGWLAEAAGYLALFGVSLAVGLVGFVIFAFFVRDPRTARQ